MHRLRRLHGGLYGRKQRSRSRRTNPINWSASPGCGLQADQRQTLPRYGYLLSARPCQHCEGKHEGPFPCVSVCPATATDYSRQTGIVSQIYTRCFGCRYCMGACPYHARHFNWWDPVWPDGMEKYLSPNVSAAHARGGGKMQLLLPSLPAGQKKPMLGTVRSIVPKGIPDRLHPGLPGRRHRFRRSEQPGTPGSPNRQTGSQTHGNKSKNPKAFRLLERTGDQHQGLLPVQPGMGPAGR
jgi:ferredoxin